MVSINRVEEGEAEGKVGAPEGAALGAAAQGDAGCAAGSGRFTNSLLDVSTASGTAVWLPLR
jgi:hypothetical protein